MIKIDQAALVAFLNVLKKEKELALGQLLLQRMRDGIYEVGFAEEDVSAAIKDVYCVEILLDRVGTSGALSAEALLSDCLDALIWCSGSNDFQKGAIAEVGWEKMCRPLIATLRARLDVKHQ